MKRSHLALSVYCLVCFLLLAPIIRTGGLQPFETNVYGLIATGISPPMTALMQGVTFLCDPLPLVVLCLTLLAVPATRRSAGICVSASASAAVVLSTVLKRLFRRERPMVLRLVEESGFSFPSSHAFTSAAIGVTLGLLAAQKIRRGEVRGAVIALCALYPLLVGISRVYLGVHYAGDVLGGWLLGTAVGLVATPVSQHLSARLFGGKTS